MLKPISSSIALIILMVTNPAYSELLFYDDCEDKWVLETDWRESNTTQGDNYVEVSSEKARAGSKSYKLYVQPFDENEISATNSGLILRGLESPVRIKNFLYDEVYWIGFSVYIPSSYSWPDSSKILADGAGEWQLLWQAHGVMDECDQDNLNPPIAAFVRNGGYLFTIKGDDRECIARPYVRSKTYSVSLKKGVWHDVVLNLKYSYSDNGFYKVWIDGEQVVDDSGMNTYKQSKGPNFVIGPYGHMERETTIYYDEFRVGGASSSFDEVSPGEGQSAQPPSDDENTLYSPSFSIIENDGLIVSLQGHGSGGSNSRGGDAATKKPHF
jgi:hypothetical protein